MVRSMKKWKNVLYAAIASMFAMTAIVVDLSALPKETTSLKAYLSHCLFTDSLVDACVYALMFLLLLAGTKRRTKSVRCSVCALAMAGIHIVSGLFLNGNVSLPTGRFNLITVCVASLGAYAFYRALLSLVVNGVEVLTDAPCACARWKCALVLFVCMLPYLLLNWPGVVHPDSYDQIKQVMGTLYPGKLSSVTADMSTFPSSGVLLNDAQPVLHTLLVGGLYALGRRLGSMNAGVTAYCVLQSALAAWMLSGGIRLAARLGVKKSILTGMAIFYAGFPVYPAYFSGIIKDSAFALAMTGALIFVAELCAFPSETVRKPGRMLAGAAYIAATGLLRKFGIAIAAVAVLLSIFYVCREYRKGFVRALAFCGGGLVVCLVLTYVVYPLCGVGKGPESEGRAAQIQQVALYVSEHEKEISEEDWQVLERYYGDRQIHARFAPTSVDRLKENMLTCRDWKDFDALYMRLPKKDASAYARTVLAMGAQYWSPRMVQTSPGSIVYMGFYGKTQKLLGKTYPRVVKGYVEPYYDQKRLVWAERAKKLIQSVARIPPFTLLFQSSLYLYAVLFALAKMGVRRRRGRGLLLILLAYGVGLCFVPVSGSVRYAFPLFAAAPVLCVLGLGMPKREPSAK